MKDIMEFDDGYKAFIEFDPEIGLFRGEFLEINGGADFYARDLITLRKEGEISLRIFKKMCEEDCSDPRQCPIKKHAS